MLLLEVLYRHSMATGKASAAQLAQYVLLPALQQGLQTCVCVFLPQSPKTQVSFGQLCSCSTELPSSGSSHVFFLHPPQVRYAQPQPHAVTLQNGFELKVQMPHLRTQIDPDI